MTKVFYIYEINDRNIPYVADSYLPDPWIREMPKYKKGKQSKVEAIFRTTGKIISAEEVDKFISEQIYGTSLWASYMKHRKKITEEVRMVELKPKLLYKLKIDTDNDICAADIKLLPKICKYAD